MTLRHWLVHQLLKLLTEKEKKDCHTCRHFDTYLTICTITTRDCVNYDKWEKRVYYTIEKNPNRTFTL